MVFQPYIKFELPLTGMGIRVSLSSSSKEWDLIRLQAVFSLLEHG